MFHKYYGIPKDAKYGESFMSRFPILFQNRKLSMQETCMCWGIECSKGWYSILEQLCTVLEYHNIEFTKKYNRAIVADQVKEKFGTLRFYYTISMVDDEGNVVNEYGETPPSPQKVTHVGDPEAVSRIAVDYLEMLADKYIAEAEDMTANTCAQCGVPLGKDNKVETQGWISYLCKYCDEKIHNGEHFGDDKEIAGENANEEPDPNAPKSKIVDLEKGKELS